MVVFFLKKFLRVLVYVIIVYARDINEFVVVSVVNRLFLILNRLLYVMI